MIEVYVLDITNLELEKYLKKLPSNFLDQVNKYKEDDQRRRSFFSWYLLYLKLVERKLNVSDLKVVFNENGKPLIEGINFNISHSHNLVAVAISSHEVGIDLELVEEKNNERIAKKIMNEEEYQKYLKNKEYFYKVWTEKEAYLKRRGLALDFALNKDYKIEDVVSYYIQDEDDNDYYLSVSPSSSKVEFVSLD
ncbi:MAG TPA: 4'-phosphopantetheinyl transferase superfamily protein [Bacilli bacterium]|nr:4'-phosphopantetheinyl transferase superfamily protein [Bacilli bacterium]